MRAAPGPPGLSSLFRHLEVALDAYFDSVGIVRLTSAGQCVRAILAADSLSSLGDQSLDRG
jgi:hypothetical protein